MTSSVPNTSDDFTGRCALITGGTKGIGAAIAQRLLAGGGRVAVAARTPAPTTPKDAVFIPADVSSAEGATALAAAALSQLGGLDILVNNAGATQPNLGGASAITDAEWLDSLSINFLSAVRLTTALLPALRKSSAAAIVNISSGGKSPMPFPVVHYSAAKAALNAYSASLAQEVGPLGIRLNVVSAGPISTPGGDEYRKAFSDATGAPADAMATHLALRRLGNPEEIAEVVALLVSERSRYVTGANYYVDGGAV